MNPKPRTESKATSPKARRHRPRPTPKWLLHQQDLDAIAQRRCLMILSVLSGEKPVTDVLQEAQISRGTYYQLEEKALKAMLAALSPTSLEPGPEPSAPARIAQLEEKVERLEQEKRRADRLLYLTRKVVKRGPVVSGAGRPRKRRHPGPLLSGSSSAPGGSSAPSTPTNDGGDGR